MKKIKLFATQIKINDITALFAGAILPLAFAPFYWWGLAVIAPIFFLLSLINLSTKRAFWCGWLFGVGLFGIGVSWIFISIHEFGNTNLVLAAIFTAIFVMVLALFPAVQACTLNKLFPNNTFTKFVLVFPLTWVLTEWIRSWLLTGFPWLLLGFSQVNSPLRGYIPLIGTYGIAFVVLFSSGLIAYNFYKAINNFSIVNSVLYGFLGLVILMIIWGSGEYLATIQWTQPLGKPLKVTLIQGNIPQDVKWQPEHVIPTLRIYYNATALHWDSDLIVWPEAAIPIPLSYAKQFIDELNNKAKLHNAAMIIGVPVEVPKSFSYYNAIITVGAGSGYYYKRHLVPFGEYVPFGNLFRGILGILSIPMSDMISGPENQPDLVAGSIKIAPFICYEIAYPDDLFRELPKANILITISNDAWFGDSFAPAQHLQIGQFRAIEGGRELLFVGNNGITAIVNSYGQIVKSLPQFKRAELTGEVVPMVGSTPWIRYGNTPIILIFWVAILGLYFISKYYKRRNKTK